MIDYKASGTLIAYMPADLAGNLYIIWVEYGGEWVVSLYRETAPEWCDGHYFPDYNEARAYFITEALDTLPITHIDKPRKLPGLVSKLNAFLEKLA